MLPTIDTTLTNSGVGGGTPLRHLETEKAIEAYKSNVPVETKQKAEKPDPREDVYQSSAERSKTDIVGRKDQAEINFQLTMEERDAFLSAFTSKQDPSSMTPEEREALQKASERISKYIDETVARNGDNRERVEKALREWYSHLTKGETDGPLDLLNLLRQAAMGNLDEFGS